MGLDPNGGGFGGAGKCCQYMMSVGLGCLLEEEEDEGEVEEVVVVDKKRMKENRTVEKDCWWKRTYFSFSLSPSFSFVVFGFFWKRNIGNFSSQRKQPN